MFSQSFGCFCLVDKSGTCYSISARSEKSSCSLTTLIVCMSGSDSLSILHLKFIVIYMLAFDCVLAML